MTDRRRELQGEIPSDIGRVPSRRSELAATLREFAREMEEDVSFEKRRAEAFVQALEAGSTKRGRQLLLRDWKRCLSPSLLPAPWCDRDLPQRLEESLTDPSKAAREYLEFCSKSVIGWDHAPYAGAAVAEAIERGYLLRIIRLRSVVTPGESYDEEDSGAWRTYWRNSVVPVVKAQFPSRFARRKDEPLAASLDQMAACRTLAELIMPESAPVGTGDWTKETIDEGIRDYRQQHQESYVRFLTLLETEPEMARRNARKLFGRNTIARALRCSMGLVSESQAFKALQKELQLERSSKGARRRRTGAHKIDQMADPNPTLDRAIQGEELNLALQELPEDLRVSMLKRLESGKLLAKNVPELVRLTKEQLSDRESHPPKRP